MTSKILYNSSGRLLIEVMVKSKLGSTIEIVSARSNNIKKDFQSVMARSLKKAIYNHMSNFDKVNQITYVNSFNELESYQLIDYIIDYDRKPKRIIRKGKAYAVSRDEKGRFKKFDRFKVSKIDKTKVDKVINKEKEISSELDGVVFKSTKDELTILDDSGFQVSRNIKDENERKRFITEYEANRLEGRR